MEHEVRAETDELLAARAIPLVRRHAGLTQEFITDDTPMGANLVGGGATFRVWAPRAQAVYLIGDFNEWAHDAAWALQRHPDGRWTGFLPEAHDGTRYKFWIEGQGSAGPKRDPYARELENDWPNPECIVRSASHYPWQATDWQPPAFNDLVVYQLHVGTFYGPDRGQRVAKFLDVVDRIEYLAALGVNAIEPLPIGEYSTPHSMGYNGSDLFSPEMDYGVEGDALHAYLKRVNLLLIKKGKQPLSHHVLAVPINQLKALVDLCHLYGIAVIMDVVYNHASGDVRAQPESIWFFDRAAGTDPNDSLYFTDQEYVGPVFAYWKEEVRQFLVDNARFFADEYRVDGFRYDQVSAIVQLSGANGWRLCQDLNGTLDAAYPADVDIAEYWGPDPAVVRPVADGGAGFHAEWHDGLRTSIRGVIGQAAGGRDAQVHWQPVVDQLRAPGFPDAWRAVQCIEDHDEVYTGRGPRIPRLAAGGDSHNWYATSRSRVATALLLTAPGIPMLFMGEECYEDKQWSDNDLNLLIDWDGLAADRTRTDFLHFASDLVQLRRHHPALRGEGIATLVADDYNRVLAFQRWIPGVGRDVVVVASLNESTQYGYRIPFPAPGPWLEAFNSDVYENWVNPIVAGNGGGIVAGDPGDRGLSASALVTIPANAVLVFTRDAGD
jgi:1,4-alpha-glucan branching enzyme